MAPTRHSPASMSLTIGLSPVADIVPRLEPTEGFRTLGVYITPSGTYRQKVKVLRKQTETFRA
jgi:hypothetical protein